MILPDNDWVFVSFLYVFYLKISSVPITQFKVTPNLSSLSLLLRGNFSPGFRNYLLAFLYSFTIYITFLQYSVNLFEQYLLTRTLFIPWICIFIFWFMITWPTFLLHVVVVCSYGWVYWLNSAQFIHSLTPRNGASLVVHVCWCPWTSAGFPHRPNIDTSCETSPMLKWHKAKSSYH